MSINDFAEMLFCSVQYGFPLVQKFNQMQKNGRKMFLERVPDDCVHPAAQWAKKFAKVPDHPLFTLVKSLYLSRFSG